MKTELKQLDTILADLKVGETKVIIGITGNGKSQLSKIRGKK